MKKFFDEYGNGLIFCIAAIVIMFIVVPSVIGNLNDNLGNTLDKTVDNAHEADNIFNIDTGPINYLIEYNLNGGTLNNSVKLFNEDTETFTIGTPIKRGYSFVGWSGTNLSGNPKTITISKGSTGDRIYTADWTIANYNITYVNLENATLSSKKETYTMNDAFTISEPSKTGYSFTGWSGTDITDTTRTITVKRNTVGDKVYTAHWTANQIEMVGKNFAGKYSATKTQSFTFDSATNGTRDYSYSISSGNNKSYFTLNNKTITAKANTPQGKYSLTIKAVDNNSGSTTTAVMNITVGKGQLDKVQNIKVSTEGVVTWDSVSNADYYNISLDGTNYKSVTSGTYNIKSQLTAKAGTYTIYVKAMANEGSNYSNSDASTKQVRSYTVTVTGDEGVKTTSGAGIYIEGSEVTLSAMFKTGYSLSKWNISTSKENSISTTVSSDISVSVTSKAQTYKINYLANGGSGTMSSTNATYGKDVTIAPNSFTKEGYTFIGWNTRADGTGTTYKEKQTVSNLTTNSVINLYAQWTRTNYTITVNFVSKTSGKQIADSLTLNGTYGETTTFTLPNAKGYETPSSTGKTVFNSTTKSITIKYEPTTYSIVLDTRGGTNISGYISTYTIESEDITLPINTTYENYVFLGWMGTDVENASKNVVIKKGSTGNRSYFAQWELATYTLTFNPNGGTVSESSRKVEYGSQYGDLPTPTRDGYTFLGWFTQAEGGTQITSEIVMSNSDVEVFAQWKQKGTYIIRNFGVYRELSTFDSKISGATSIIITNKVLTTEQINDSVDLSKEGDKSVLGYLDGTTYYITSNKAGQKVIADKSIARMFYGLSNITNIDLSNFDTSNVTDMHYMFYDCKKLTSLDVGNFDTSKVKDMSGMFMGCSGLTSLDVSNFNTSNVTQMYQMFDTCSSLTSLDLSNFDTSKVIQMYEMFGGCSSLTSLDLSSFDTSNLTNTSNMFHNCKALNNIYVGPSWSISEVVESLYMFYNCFKLPNYDSSVYGVTKAYVGEGGYLTLKS